MSKIYQQLKETTPEVVESWVDMYYKIIESRIFILLVIILSNFLYSLSKVIYRIINFGKKP